MIEDGKTLVTSVSNSPQSRAPNTWRFKWEEGCLSVGMDQTFRKYA